MGRKKSSIWIHVEKIESRFICKYCGSVYAGGATRIKYHLLGGNPNITTCKSVPPDVQEGLTREYNDDDPNPGGEILGAQTIVHHAASNSSNGPSTGVGHWSEATMAPSTNMGEPCLVPGHPPIDDNHQFPRSFTAPSGTLASIGPSQSEAFVAPSDHSPPPLGDLDFAHHGKEFLWGPIWEYDHLKDIYNYKLG